MLPNLSFTLLTSCTTDVDFVAGIQFICVDPYISIESLSGKKSGVISQIAQNIKVDSYLLAVSTRVYARKRCTVHTSGVFFTCACTRAYPAGTRRKNNVIMTSKRRRDVVLTSSWRYYCVVCPLGRRARAPKPVELSRPPLIFHPIKYVCGGHAQPTDIDAVVIYARIRAYVHTYRYIIHNASVRRNIGPRCCPAWRIHVRAYTRVDEVKKYESLPLTM